MPNPMQAASGQVTEMRQETGPTSYPNGDGFTVTSDLGRVDNYMVGDDSTSFISKNDPGGVVNNNQMVVRVFSVNSNDPSNSLNEITDGQDLSGETYTFFAQKL